MVSNGSDTVSCNSVWNLESGLLSHTLSPFLLSSRHENSWCHSYRLYHSLLCRPIVVLVSDSLLEGHESPALNLASKPPGLALTLWVSRPMVMSRVRQGVNEYRLYSLRQMRSLASYNRIPKQLLVSNVDYHSLDQEVSIRSYSYQYSLLWVWTKG